MDAWLKAALDYVPRWLDYQVETWRQPGCILAVAHRGRVVFEHATGHANTNSGEALTPRHRFRAASHSKSFTSAGILKLREQNKLRLDDPVGRHVGKLHPAIARTTIAQVLSHSAGFIRDGDDSGFFARRRPFPAADEMMEVLSAPPAIEPGTRFKYSNYGFALLGSIIETLTGEPYASWMKREVIAAAGLDETVPDMPLPRGTPMAQGHGPLAPYGRRLVIPPTYSLQAMTAAGGFVTTAHDLALFFNQLAPDARRSVLAAASRREMTRRQWRIPDNALEEHYGLGIMSGALAGWEWFGHTGGLPGYVSRTATFPAQGLTICVLTNASDGWAWPWVDGTIHILQRFVQGGAPSRATAGWTGRWWALGGCLDLVPMKDKVAVASPGGLNPFLNSSDLTVTGRDRARITRANGYASHGEPARLVRGAGGRVREIQFGASRLVTEAAIVREMTARFGARQAVRKRTSRKTKS